MSPNKATTDITTTEAALKKPVYPKYRVRIEMCEAGETKFKHLVEFDQKFKDVAALEAYAPAKCNELKAQFPKTDFLVRVLCQPEPRFPFEFWGSYSTL